MSRLLREHRPLARRVIAHAVGEGGPEVTIASVPARGAAVAVILPAAEHAEAGREFLRLEEVHVQRVHRSLERRFCVFTARRLRRP